MATQTGKKYVLRFSEDAGTTWLMAVCESESGVSMRTDTTSEQTKCFDGAVITAPGAKSWTMSGSGVVDAAPGSGKVSGGDFTNWWNAGTELLAKITDTDGTLAWSGSVWITQLDITAPLNGSLAYSLQLTGNGALTYAED